MSGLSSDTRSGLATVKLWFWAPLALVVAGLTLLPLFRQGPPEPVILLEIEIGELTLRDGRLFQAGQPAPFTGAMIERYPDGPLKSRSDIVDGLLHGVSEGWHTNGVIQVREHFKEGVSHGPRMKWGENGNLLSETTIRDGEHHGTFRRWHENGQLAEAVEMRAGHPDGISLAYYPSGFLKARLLLQAGQVIEQEFWGDGEFSEFDPVETVGAP